MALGDNDNTGVPIYVLTNKVFPLYLISEPVGKKINYFFTPQLNIKYILTEPLSYYTKYLFTPVFKSAYLFTPTVPEIDIPNECRYPTELDEIRNKAVILYYKEISKVLKDSIYNESYGKVSMTGYNKTGMMRILIDYLSAIWIQKDYDSRSGLVRTADYYWVTYKIYDVISNFRECNMNIKPIVALFNLNSYTVKDDEWPNYFMMDKVINPPDEDKQKEMKQWTDIYTLQNMTPDRNQSINTLDSSQTSFFPTKNIKYFSAFTINGVDYTGYTDYNANSVTYSPSITFGYNIESSDTVIITYWYEE
jgi:hypothetical protein